MPCQDGKDICSRCSRKTADCKVQTSSRFDHGKVNEPIPDQSHIYGGKWFETNVKKWGQPDADILEFAIKHQRDARRDCGIAMEQSAEPPIKNEIVGG